MDNPCIYFSVILPFYNSYIYIEKSIESLLNQNFSDFELICIDDGSTDKSIEIIQKYLSEDERIKLIHQENLGQGIARNNAIKQAKGKYIVFLDSDDWLETNALSEIYSSFEKYTDADVVEYNYKKVNTESNIVSLYNFASKVCGSYLNIDITNKLFYNKDNIIHSIFLLSTEGVWSRAYKKDFLNKNKILFNTTRNNEDFLFTHKVTLCAKKIYYIDKYLYNYRVGNINSLTRKIQSANMCEFENIKTTKELLLKENLYDKYKADYNEYAYYMITRQYFFVPDEMKQLYRKQVKEILSSRAYKRFIEHITMIRNNKSEISLIKHIYNLYKLYFTKGNQ